MDECKANTALDILIGKWKPIILYHLGQSGTLRFSGLQRAIPEITKKMLTAQLRELEYHDIVHREIYMQIPPKVEYSITEYGQDVVSDHRVDAQLGTEACRSSGSEVRGRQRRSRSRKHKLKRKPLSGLDRTAVFDFRAGAGRAYGKHGGPFGPTQCE